MIEKRQNKILKCHFSCIVCRMSQMLYAFEFIHINFDPKNLLLKVIDLKRLFLKGFCEPLVRNSWLKE